MAARGHNRLSIHNGLRGRRRFARHHLNDAAFIGACGVGDDDLEHEAIQLGFRQGVSAFLFDGVHRGQHHKRLWQAVGGIAQGDLPLLHTFQQGRLDFGRRAVDLIGQQQVGEDWPQFGPELARAGVVHQRSHQVRRQKIRGELHTLKL